MEVRYELNETLYANATIEKFDSISIWLGANVMLEYPILEGKQLLTEQHKVALQTKETLNEDL